MAFYIDRKVKFDIAKSIHENWPRHQGTHFHDVYEIYHLIEGSILYYIGDDVYSIDEGDFVCIPTMASHETKPYKREAHKRILMQFSSSYVAELTKDAPDVLDFINKVSVFSLPDDLKLYANMTLELLIKEQDKGERKSNFFIKSLFGTLLAIMKMNYSKDSHDSYTHKGKMPQKLVSILKYISDNYAEELSLNVLAEKFFLHPSYLSNLFKTSIGLSYTKYLNEIRIANALVLLTSTDYKIIDIATKCGFNSSTHFCRVFKSCMGISPLKHREITKTK